MLGEMAAYMSAVGFENKEGIKKSEAVTLPTWYLMVVATGFEPVTPAV